MFQNRVSAIALASAFSIFHHTALAETIRTDDVVVTASRVAQSADELLADVTVINREEIERAGQSTLTELLQRQPGVEISSNGGAGKQSSVFLRGTNSDHVVVLVDGLRINSATLGTTSFEGIPLAQIERIEILRGPASSLYGADAIGGVIQIFTRRGHGAPTLNAFVGYGRYKTRRAEAGVSGSSDRTRYAINLSSLDSDGFSAQKVDSGLDADSDPYRNLSVSASISHQLAEGHELEAQYFYSDGHNDYDCNNSTCNNDQLLRSYGLTSRNRILSNWNSTLKIGVGVDDSVDHSAFPGAFRTEQRQYSWQNDLTLPAGILTLAYDRLEQEVSGTTDYDVTSRDNNGWLASYLVYVGPHSLQASLRRDGNSQFGNHTTRGLSYAYRFTPAWSASASYGTAFKAPTFNQLYFPGFGNPDLVPETSRNREVSLRYQGEASRAGVTAFYNEVEDLIVFSGPPSGFNPINVGEARLRGLTLDSGWQFTNHWHLGGNLTIQSPRSNDTGTLLPRRAQRHGTLNLDYRAERLQAGMELVASSERYNNLANTKRMAGYALINLTASYALRPEWKIEARLNNLLGKDYILAHTGNGATSAPFEMPGTDLFIGLRWQPQ
jgi:vitamin B12 transporter